MAVGTLHYWSYLALHNNVQEQYKDTHYLEKIISKFREGTVKTEKLSSNNNFSIFALRLNDQERVICTVKKHESTECLVILEVLPKHEYHKSKYLKSSRDITLNIEDIT